MPCRMAKRQSAATCTGRLAGASGLQQCGDSGKQASRESAPAELPAATRGGTNQASGLLTGDPAASASGPCAGRRTGSE
jgi:hypothetical protein